MKQRSIVSAFALTLMLFTGIHNSAVAGTRFEAMLEGRDTLVQFQRHLGSYVRLLGGGGRLVVSDAQNFRIVLYDMGSTLENSTPVGVIGTLGLPEDLKTFEETGKERLNSQFSVAYLNDTIYVANVKSRELLQFTRDGVFIGSWRVTMRLLDTEGGHLYGFSADSIYVWDAGAEKFLFQGVFPGTAGSSADQNHPTVRLGPNRLAVRKDTTVALFDLGQLLLEPSVPPLFTAHSSITPEVGFTDSLFLWSTSYSGHFGACNLNGTGVTSGNIGIYNPSHNWYGGKFYGCSHSGQRTMTPQLGTVSIIARTLTYLNLYFLGADDANLYFYDGAWGGLLRAPLDDAHGQYIVSFTNRVGGGAPIKMIRPATHYVYALDESPAATAPIRVYSFDSLITRQFNSSAAVAIGTIGDTVLALSGNRVYHYTANGAMVSMITLATTDTSGHLAFTCSPTQLFLASGTAIKVFNRNGSLAATHDFTLQGPNTIFMAGSSIFSNSPPAFISIGTGTVNNIVGVDWNWYFHQGRYWYGSARNVYSYWPLGVTGISEGLESKPQAFALDQNYPNPFNPSTTIRVHNAAPARIRLVVYDILGQEVAVLMDGVHHAGVHEVRFDASGLASGVYIARLSAGTEHMTREMVLVR